MNAVEKRRPVKRAASLGKRMRRHWQLYVLMIPALLYFPLFRYAPMYGLQLAFKTFKARMGITASPWVGLKHFDRLFHSYVFSQLIGNTLLLSFLQLVVGFAAPVLLALALNNLVSQRVKRTVQTIAYAPHFISTVVLVSIINIFFAYNGGLVNELLKYFGADAVLFLGKEQYFRPLYVLSDVWQNTGWNAIIYIAALTGVDPELHEAAKIDGASKLQRTLHVDLPHIVPTMVILLIMNTGKIMSLGSEKALLMQNDLNIGASEIISTYVYKLGILQSQYEFSTAVDLFNGVVNLVLLTTVNLIAKKVSDTSLF